MSEWIGVDLDGTLAKYSKGQGSAIGKPFPAMVKKIEGWIDNKIEVRIFTARADSSKEREKIKKWLKDNGLPDLVITNIKDRYMQELWDDKAIRVSYNTGKPCAGCSGTSKFHQIYLTDC